MQCASHAAIRSQFQLAVGLCIFWIRDSNPRIMPSPMHLLSNGAGNITWKQTPPPGMLRPNECVLLGATEAVRKDMKDPGLRSMMCVNWVDTSALCFGCVTPPSLKGLCCLHATTSTLERRLIQDSLPCTSPNSHELSSATHPNWLQLFYDALLAFSPSQHVLHWSGDDPSKCFISLLSNTFLSSSSSNSLPQLPLCPPSGSCRQGFSDRSSNIRRLVLPLPLDRHEQCRCDANSMPSRLSTVLAMIVFAPCRNSCDNRRTTRSS